jgi:hypothetical protein
MPFTYEYTDGEHRWDERRSHAERDLPAVCPSCGKVGQVVFSARGQVVAIPRRFLNGVTKADLDA